MVLIIPSIPIVHGVCGAQIASLAHEVHHADRDIYSQDPVDRARLFRKENAKMLHLEFLDRDPWDESSLAIIRNMRDAVDIPFGVSLIDTPNDESALALLFEVGIMRIFLPEDTPESLFLQYCHSFTSRRIIPTVDLSFDFETLLPHYHSLGIERLALDVSHGDTLESGGIDWERLSAIAAAAKTASVRLTALHGVRGYPELKRLQEIGAALDSLILCRALNENRFPCQLIWREVEAEAAFESTPARNLWSNPLEGKPHI
jgi:phosphoribosylformimino-5-aminoimidazole carboxamide ribotide isomerase